jgi:signal transduction histidine kinase
MQRIEHEAYQASIMVVDDTMDDLRLLSGLLKAHGYMVRPIKEGTMAIDSVHTESPDLILLDIRMPDVDGYTICQTLKADKATRDIPVIFISALDDTPDKVKGLLLGGADYITKPFRFEEVLARVEAHLTIRAMQRQLQEKNELLQQEVAERKQIEVALREANTRLSRYATTLEELAVSRERNRLARDLHDTLAHTLSGIILQLEAAQAVWETDTQQACTLLQTAQNLARGGLSEARSAVQDLRTNVLNEVGLGMAIHQQAVSAAQRSGFQLSLHGTTSLEGLPYEVEQNIYRIVQEALTNVERHAHATQVTIRLHQDEQDMAMTIADDGVGFDNSKQPPEDTFGLCGIYERALLIGAELKIESAVGRGTTIRLMLPQAHCE